MDVAKILQFLPTGIVLPRVLGIHKENKNDFVSFFAKSRILQSH